MANGAELVRAVIDEAAANSGDGPVPEGWAVDVELAVCGGIHRALPDRTLVVLQYHGDPTWTLSVTFHGGPSYSVGGWRSRKAAAIASESVASVAPEALLRYGFTEHRR